MNAERPDWREWFTVYGDGRIESPHLTVPHPRITERAFVLLPWAEIAPDRVRTEHLARLSDQEITKIQGI